MHSNIIIGIDKQWPEGMLLQHCTHLGQCMVAITAMSTCVGAWRTLQEHWFTDQSCKSVTADVLSVYLYRAPFANRHATTDRRSLP